MASKYKLIETKDFARCGLDWIEAQKEARKRQDAERDRMYGPVIRPVPPVNEFEAAARERKVGRLIERLDRNAGHPVTADEVMSMSREQINAACIGEKRQPSDTTIKAMADALLAREVR